ncbi:MAG: hypothetical protein GX456_17460 [Verrucomicrobia bacterium]|nr:hypothetical protein [Verrucomicrobiota bacterium]
MSKGYHERVIVEVKLSSNAKFLDGLTAQLPTYLHAENARHGVFVLIKVGEHEKKLKRIAKVHRTLRKDGKPIPDLIVIDATEKLAASRLKGFFDYDADAAE